MIINSLSFKYFYVYANIVNIIIYVHTSKYIGVFKLCTYIVYIYIYIYILALSFGPGLRVFLGH